MEHELLRGMADDERRRVLSLARRRRFRRKDSLFHEGDPGDTIHLLARGHVAIQTTTRLGDIVTMAVFGPGASFGELAVLDPEETRTASAVALDEVETLVLHRRDIEELRRTEPGFDRALLEVLRQQVVRLSTQLREALYLPVETRVARRLVDVTAIYPMADDGAIEVPITQEQLATMAGTTRPTANIVLKDLEARGLLTLSRGRIVVPDPAALRQRAGAD